MRGWLCVFACLRFYALRLIVCVIALLCFCVSCYLCASHISSKCITQPTLFPIQISNFQLPISNFQLPIYITGSTNGSRFWPRRRFFLMWLGRQQQSQSESQSESQQPLASF
jgi:hypothetical protein